jgi:ribokinase
MMNLSLDKFKKIAEDLFKDIVPDPKEKAELIPAFKVNAIDTTAAGDSFIGAVASKLVAEELSFKSLKNAIVFGNKVSSIVVQKSGAQPSIPMKQEVIDIYGEDCN